ncbi:Serine/threonine-protein kinase cot-1 [Beauveria bassiana]|nr:Serine/threonine-protein kinase cot-1 [Beauveria bassiana]KAH8720202.1 Serine/threonine-protein kinase cot-1 [Beauveria bassiana]
MDGNNNNRLHLNFGNDRLPMPNDRTYPTTPSTFPQPVFPPSSAGQLQAATMQQQAAYGAAGYAPQGYFSQGQYQQQSPLPQQPQYPSASYDYNGVPAPGGGAQYQQPRSNTPGSDPNTGLAHQFSHQNLGGVAVRQAPYAPRAGAHAQRPRTAGGSSQQPTYSNYSNIPLPTQGGASAPCEFQPTPERNPDKYGSNANSNQKKCSQLAADFFKDSVKRARERNQRSRSRPR